MGQFAIVMSGLHSLGKPNRAPVTISRHFSRKRSSATFSSLVPDVKIGAGANMTQHVRLSVCPGLVKSNPCKSRLKLAPKTVIWQYGNVAACCATPASFVFEGRNRNETPCLHIYTFIGVHSHTILPGCCPNELRYRPKRFWFGWPRRTCG